MNIFDKCIDKLLLSIGDEKVKSLSVDGCDWEMVTKNPFLMDRDTFIELGGYPEQSINIIASSSRLLEQLDKAGRSELCDGVYCIGAPELLSKAGHISFGKIVLLETQEIPDEEWYNFTQSELMCDTSVRMKEIMVRQSPTHYNINLRISKKAHKEGFDARVLGKAVYDAFLKINGVKSVRVILLFGDSKLYASLLETAEKIKEITLTLNHIFDGINMDCGSCDLSEICLEVEGLRELHKKKMV